MDWIKKNPAQFSLAVVSVGLLASALDGAERGGAAVGGRLSRGGLLGGRGVVR